MRGPQRPLQKATEQEWPYRPARPVLFFLAPQEQVAPGDRLAKRIRRRVPALQWLRFAHPRPLAGTRLRAGAEHVPETHGDARERRQHELREHDPDLHPGSLVSLLSAGGAAASASATREEELSQLRALHDVLGGRYRGLHPRGL